MRNRSIVDIPGIRVGQVQNTAALTGCTVVLCEKGAVAGVDQRGGSPGTRETDLLNPLNQVEKVHAILLAGGSAFGLDAAAGVMRYLEERKVGFNTGAARVPIVPAAILYDLAIGKADIRPDAEMGYRACQSASRAPVREGNAGAGCGATVGKILGMRQAMKSGIGSAGWDIGGGVLVTALMAVNALGDIIDPQSGRILAGARPVRVGPVRIGAGNDFADTQAVLASASGRAITRLMTGSNTVIGVVATNARLTKAEAAWVARMAQDGLARVIRPAHTRFDGDTLFALSAGQKHADISTLGAYAAEAVSQAILRAVHAARSAGGIPALNE